MYGRHFKITGNCIRRNSGIRLMIKMRTEVPKKKSVRRAMKMTGR
jgi:hypothetical protein